MSRWLLVCVFLAASSPLRSFAEDIKLGYVDVSRALGETDDGRKAKASLKKIFDQKQKEIDEQQEDLKKSVDDLDKKRTLMPADKVREQEAELQQRIQKIQQTYMRHQQDLQAKEQEATGKIVERMNRIIQKIAASESFTMIFDRQQGGVVYAKPHLDLTNELIRRYNAGEGAGPAGSGDGAARSSEGVEAKAPAPKK